MLHVSVNGQNDLKRARLLLIPLALLLVAAAALFFLAARLNAPLMSASGTDTEGYRHIRSVYGSGPDRLHRPTEVFVDGSGRIYVADSFKHRIVIFDSSGVFQGTVGGPANVEGALRYPGAVVVDPRGRVYTTSKDPSRVVIYNVDGSVLRSFEVDDPQTLALSRDSLFITTRDGILVGDLDGNQTGQLSGFGSDPGRIDRPTGMAVADDGTIFLADSLNYRFQALTSSGEPIWTLGDPIENESAAVRDQSRSYGLPSDVTLGSDGLLYAIDAFNGEIVVLNQAGEQVATYGTWGRQDAQFYYPSSIAEISPELFVVADTFNDRLQILRIPSPAPTPGIYARRALPWVVPAALLLLMLALLRRPVRVVADTAGLRRADSLGVMPDLLEQARRIWVPAGTAEAVVDLFEAHEGLADAVREVEFDDLAEDEDPLLGLAERLRGKVGLRRVAVAFPGVPRLEQVREMRFGVLEVDGPDGEAITEPGLA